MLSYEERMEELEKRGIDTDSLLSDWCVSCKHSNEIKNGICLPKCTGRAISDGRRLIMTEHTKMGTTTVDGEVVRQIVPIGYEEEVEVEI